MLTQTLRSLERDGIIDREVFACVPPKVEYTLTPLGESLATTLDELRIWAEQHIEDVLRHRQSFDKTLQPELQSTDTQQSKRVR